MSSFGDNMQEENANTYPHRTEEITYGFVVRATKDAILEINQFLEELNECRLVYQMSSPVKLKLVEEVY